MTEESPSVEGGTIEGDPSTSLRFAQDDREKGRFAQDDREKGRSSG